jgi:hypothetical protein
MEFYPDPARALITSGLARMTDAQRLEFVDWRNPQYRGPFSCLGRNGQRLTWIPRLGIMPASCSLAQRID